LVTTFFNILLGAGPKAVLGSVTARPTADDAILIWAGFATVWGRSQIIDSDGVDTCLAILRRR
jgi:hypothetical protein